MLEVQHLVVNDVLQRVAWYSRMIEDSADHDRVVGGIVMGQSAARANLAPGHLRARQQSVKEPQVEFVEDMFQVIEDSTRRLNPLTSAHLPYQMGLGANVLAGHVAAKATGMRRLDRLPVNLGQKNMCDCFDDSSPARLPAGRRSARGPSSRANEWCCSRWQKHRTRSGTPASARVAAARGRFSGRSRRGLAASCH